MTPERRHPASPRLAIALALILGGSVLVGSPTVHAQSAVDQTPVAQAQDPAPHQLDVTNGRKTKSTRRNLANVRIPAIGVTTPLNRGIGDNVLAQGLGLWPGTGTIGKPGNAVIAGHRTSHTRPLFDIHKLKKGDSIFFTTPQGVAEYRVTKTQIVKPNAMWITRPTKAATITLFACHPPHSIAYRWVVFAKLHSMSPSQAVKLSQ